jgi:hypothetical protein
MQDINFAVLSMSLALVGALWSQAQFVQRREHLEKCEFTPWRRTQMLSLRESQNL